MESAENIDCTVDPKARRGSEQIQSYLPKHMDGKEMESAERKDSGYRASCYNHMRYVRRGSKNYPELLNGIKQSGYRFDVDNRSESGSIGLNDASRRKMSVFTVPRSADETKAAALRRGLQGAHSFRNVTEKDKQVMGTFSSLSYAPSSTEVYKQFLRLHSQKLGWDRWLLVTIIGVCTGLWSCLLKQCLQFLDRVRWSNSRTLTQDGDIISAWGWVTGLSILFIFIGSFLVTFVHAPAAGSGTPEVISFLNGVVVHGTLSLKNFIVKFAANVFSVSSGLPLAVQGPIIAMGAVIGAGVGQFRSKSLGLSPPWFERFRNAEDRRTFTTAGVAAGVAAAFNAPVGAILFAMEDLSSFWSRRVCWQTFFCCGVAAALSNVINTAFTGFSFAGSFGPFSTDGLLEPIQIHVAIFLPAIFLGVVGGILGAIFTRVNAFVINKRKEILNRISNITLQRCLRILEVIIYACIMSTVTSFLPSAFPCLEANFNSTRLLQDCYMRYQNSTGATYVRYTCSVPNSTTGTAPIVYNEVASLMQGSGTAFLNNLLSRGTQRLFGYAALSSAFAFWFSMTIMVCGAANAGGVFIPTLISGALFGRFIGVGMMDLYQIFSPDHAPVPVNTLWDWMDPGIMAVLGAASLLGGVTRLTLAGTVIIVEMFRAPVLTVPIMVTIFVAKIVADVGSKPLFQYLIELKNLPFLNDEPKVILHGHVLNLELYRAKHIMCSPVDTLFAVETVASLASVLVETGHAAFPVVKRDRLTGCQLAYGTITRTELYVILCNEQVYNEVREGTVINPVIDYDELSIDYVSDPSAALERVKMYTRFPLFRKIRINLENYINQSALRVDENYSLHRTYALFRTLGLRHLIVNDVRNRVVGIITRKDLISFNMRDRLLERAKRDDLRAQEGLQGRDNWAFATEAEEETKDVVKERNSNEYNVVHDDSLVTVSESKEEEIEVKVEADNEESGNDGEGRKVVKRRSTVTDLAPYPGEEEGHGNSHI